MLKSQTLQMMLVPDTFVVMMRNSQVGKSVTGGPAWPLHETTHVCAGDTVARLHCSKPPKPTRTTKEGQRSMVAARHNGPI